jgi:general secretion pathway protein K
MRRPGFALIAVFWIIMVVGLFAAIVASRTGYNIERSGWAVDIGRVRAATDGAVEEAAFELIGRLGSGAPVTNLTGAQPELLAALLDVVLQRDPKLAVDDSLTLSERIADFRDIDNLRRLHGAEDPEYNAEGLAAGAKDAAFDTVGELYQGRKILTHGVKQVVTGVRL